MDDRAALLARLKVMRQLMQELLAFPFTKKASLDLDLLDQTIEEMEKEQ